MILYALLFHFILGFIIGVIHLILRYTEGVIRTRHLFMFLLYIFLGYVSFACVIAYIMFVGIVKLYSFLKKYWDYPVLLNKSGRELK